MSYTKKSIDRGCGFNYLSMNSPFRIYSQYETKRTDDIFHLWQKRVKAPLENLGTQTIPKISPPDYEAHIFVVFYFYNSSGSLAIKKNPYCG